MSYDTLVILVAINTVFNAALVIKTIYDLALNKIGIEVKRDFKTNKPKGLSVTLWKYPIGESPNSGQVIFGLGDWY